MSEEATTRYGHGMLPDHPQMRCVDCNQWSYLAARINGRAGRCYSCEGIGEPESGSTPETMTGETT